MMVAASVSPAWASNSGEGIRGSLDERYVDRSHPFYETEFDSPQALQDWVLEGGQAARTENGNLILESEYRPGVQRRDQNHLVFWLKKEVPADFLMEFSVRPQDRSNGLNIIFFNARGIHGESIFDPGLKKRDGRFRHYTKGDLDSYHVSYWASDRGSLNVRKNKGFHLVASGKDMITSGAPGTFQKVSLYKCAGHIRLAIDGELAVRYDDDGESYGPIHSHSGWIGLRQMGHTLRSEYGYVKIYPVMRCDAMD